MQADDVGLDRELAMAAIDEHRQADPRRAAQVADRVQGGADRPAREQDVVHQHDLGTVDGEGELGAAKHGPAPASPQVVAVERDVDGPHHDLVVGEQRQFLGQPLGERYPASPHADQVKWGTRSTPVPDFPGHGDDQGLGLLGAADNLFVGLIRKTSGAGPIAAGTWPVLGM